MWWGCLSQNVQCHSLSVCHLWWDCLSQNELYHLLPICHEKDRWDYLSQMCNATHSLFVIAKHVMRLPLTKAFNVAHILLVVGKKYIEQFFRSICNVTHILWVMSNILISSLSSPLNQHNMMPTFYIYMKRCDSTAFINYSQSIEQNNVSESTCSKVASITHFLLSGISFGVKKEKNNVTDSLLPQYFIRGIHISQKYHIHPICFAIAGEVALKRRNIYCLLFWDEM